MPELTCHIKDCDRTNRLKRGLCSRHYQQAAKLGTLPDYHRPPEPPKYCKVDGCESLAKPGRQDMCGKHANRVVKYGDPHYITPNPRRNGVEPCSVEGCDKISKALLLCAMHYDRQYKHGDPLAEGVTRSCVICGTNFVKKTGKRVCCSLECRKEQLLRYGRGYQATFRVENPKPPVDTFPARCWFCHSDFDATRRKFRYCSIECQQVHHGRADNPYVIRRKERMAAATVEKFTKKEIYDRDGWVCGICGDSISKECQYPDAYSASLDHIIPLAKDGEHSRANTRAAHLICNIRKGSRMQ